jgi:hypothetical protein
VSEQVMPSEAPSPWKVAIAAYGEASARHDEVMRAHTNSAFSYARRRPEVPPLVAAIFCPNSQPAFDPLEADWEDQLKQYLSRLRSPLPEAELVLAQWRAWASRCAKTFAKTGAREAKARLMDSAAELESVYKACLATQPSSLEEWAEKATLVANWGDCCALELLASEACRLSSEISRSARFSEAISAYMDASPRERT